MYNLQSIHKFITNKSNDDNIDIKVRQELAYDDDSGVPRSGNHGYVGVNKTKCLIFLIQRFLLMTVLYMMKSVFNVGICQLMWQKWMQLQASQSTFLCKP